jgi:hypothetical protein
MAGFGRKRWTKAALCAAALATPLAVTGCQSATNTSAASGPVATQTGAPAAPSTSATAAAPSSAGTAGTAASSSAPVTALNATAGTGLTVSSGGSQILMNGRAVDFGTKVLDPAWSPDGRKVAFIDGAGNLVVANADGTGRTVAARNPGTQNWSHPTWQTTPADKELPARNNIFFASSVDGGTLFEVPADAHEAQPEKLGIGGVAGQGGGQSPTVGNTWPAVSGRFGGGVYEHDNGTDTEVYIRDDYLRQQSWAGIKDAAEPDYVLVGGSATSQGTPEVVFVRRVGGHEHVFEQNILTGTGTGGSAAAARDLTPNATADCTEPALSADGKTVAYSTPTGVFTISATGSGTPAQVTGTPGFPAFRSGS